MLSRAEHQRREHKARPPLQPRRDTVIPRQGQTDTADLIASPPYPPTHPPLLPPPPPYPTFVTFGPQTCTEQHGQAGAGRLAGYFNRRTNIAASKPLLNHTEALQSKLRDPSPLTLHTTHYLSPSQANPNPIPLKSLNVCSSTTNTVLWFLALSVSSGPLLLCCDC